MAQYTVPESLADANTTGDVSIALAAWVATVPDGKKTLGAAANRIVFPAGADFWAESGLHLKDRHGLEVDFTGSLLYAKLDGTSRTRCLVSVEGSSSDIDIIEPQLRGSAPVSTKATVKYISALEAQHGIQFVGYGVGFNVVGGFISQVHGDFVYTGKPPHPGAPSPSKVLVTGLKGRMAGRMGMSATACNDVQYLDCDIDIVARHFFDLEPEEFTWQVGNVEIGNHVLGYSHLGFLAAGGRGPVNDVNVHDVALSDTPLLITVGATQNTDGSYASRENWNFERIKSKKSWASSVTPAVAGFSRVTGLNVSECVQEFVIARKNYFLAINDCPGYTTSGNSYPGAVAEVYEAPKGT